MVIDVLKNWDLYSGLDEQFARAFACHKRLVAEDAPDGRYEFDGDRLFALVSTYSTGAAIEQRYEAHRRYADLQCLVEGSETIYWAPVEGLTPDGDYSPAKDIVFFNDAPGSALILHPGLFTLFFPVDAHKPACCVHQPERVRKVVVKIGLDQDLRGL